MVHTHPKTRTFPQKKKKKKKKQKTESNVSSLGHYLQYLGICHSDRLAQSAGAVEYTNSTSAEW